MSPHLVYYKTERDKLTNTKYDQKISQLEAIGLVHYMCSYFKVPVPDIEVKGNKYNKFIYPKARSGTPIIRFINTYLVSGDVSHEFAHYLQYLEKGESRHDSKMLSYTKRVQRQIDKLI